MADDDCATIILRRERGGWRDFARAYSVMIDGQQIAKVRRGQQVVLPVTSGPHELFLTIDWCRSPSLRLDVQAGSVVRLVCAPGGAAVEGLRAVAGDNAQAYIRLVQVEDT